MNGFDSLIWRSGIVPTLRHNITMLLTLDSIPEWNDFVGAHTRAVELIPRLRQRVVEPICPVLQPTWRQDSRFDLDGHLRWVTLPGSEALEEVLAIARDFGQAPFNRSQSPWEALLIENPSSGRAWYVLKLHHAMVDGLALVQWLSTAILTETPVLERDGSRAMTMGATASPMGQNRYARKPGRSSGSLSAARNSRPSWGLYIKSAAEASGAVVRSLVQPKMVQDTSPLFASSGLKWRFITHDISLQRFKEAAQRAEGTVNDVFIAGIARMFSLYHEKKGVAVDRVTLGASLNLRDELEASVGGNGFMILNYAVPLCPDDGGTQVQLAKEATADALGSADPLTTRIFNGIASRLPRSAVVRIAGSGAGSVDIQVTNVRGMDRIGYLAGTAVTRVYAFAPLTGCAAVVSIWSHAGTCCIGVNVDPDTITDVDLLDLCLRSGFEDILMAKA